MFFFLVPRSNPQVLKKSILKGIRDKGPTRKYRKKTKPEMVVSRPPNWLGRSMRQISKKICGLESINLGVTNLRLHTSVHFRDRSCGGNHGFWQQVPQLRSADSFTRQRSYLWMEWTLTASVMQLLNIQVTQMRQQRGGV